jgi:hypothetical protein
VAFGLFRRPKLRGPEMSTGSVEPARGERRAASGYGAQYRFAAFLIYRGLCQDRVGYVRIADLEAGRVDDLQLGDDARLDAYQIKWAQYGGSITFNELIREGSPSTPGGPSEPSLIAQLADGWNRLQRPGVRIVVHLLTNRRPLDE